MHEYEALIRPENDAHAGNNKAARWIEVTGGPRLVLATRYQDDPLARVLRALDFSVETVTETSGLHPGMLSGAPLSSRDPECRIPRNRPRAPAWCASRMESRSPRRRSACATIPAICAFEGSCAARCAAAATNSVSPTGNRCSVPSVR